MEPLYILPTKDSPGVTLDSNLGIFEFTETSIIQDAIEFYLPVLLWIDEYSLNPNPITTVKFKFWHINSASVKEILIILRKLEKIGRKHELNIQWYYQEDDNDMLTTSLMFDQILQLNIEFIEY